MWLPLQPYKKATVAHGSLHVGCWVTSYSERTTSLVDSHHQGSHGLQLHSPSIRHSNRGRDETGLHSDTNLQDTEEVPVLCMVCVHVYLPYCKATEVPEVTGVSPNEGPVEGGQRVVLRGSYLGVSREDIVQVLVAGVDCTSSLEYFSSCEFFSLYLIIYSFYSQASCCNRVKSCSWKWPNCGQHSEWWDWCIMDQILFHCQQRCFYAA